MVPSSYCLCVAIVYERLVGCYAGSCRKETGSSCACCYCMCSVPEQGSVICLAHHCCEAPGRVFVRINHRVMCCTVLAVLCCTCVHTTCIGLSASMRSGWCLGRTYPVPHRLPFPPHLLSRIRAWPVQQNVRASTSCSRIPRTSGTAETFVDLTCGLVQQRRKVGCYKKRIQNPLSPETNQELYQYKYPWNQSSTDSNSARYIIMPSQQNWTHRFLPAGSVLPIRLGPARLPELP